MSRSEVWVRPTTIVATLVCTDICGEVSVGPAAVIHTGTCNCAHASIYTCTVGMRTLKACHPRDVSLSSTRKAGLNSARQARFDHLHIHGTCMARIAYHSINFSGHPGTRIHGALKSLFQPHGFSPALD